MRIKMHKFTMMLTALMTVLVLAGCGNTNTSDDRATSVVMADDVVEYSPEDIAAEGYVEDYEVEEHLEEYIPATHTDYVDWVDFGIVSIPSSWAFTVYDGPGPLAIEIIGEGAGGAIHMMIWGIPFGNPYMVVDGFSSQQIFAFDDGRKGYMLKDPVSEYGEMVVWVEPDMEIALSLFDGGNENIFAENEALILRIARTLTAEAPRTFAMEVWQEAYIALLRHYAGRMLGNYYDQHFGGFFILHDIDHSGIPELIVANSFHFTDYLAGYAFVDGDIRSLYIEGFADYSPGLSVPPNNKPGIITRFREGPFSQETLMVLDGNRLVSEMAISHEDVFREGFHRWYVDGVEVDADAYHRAFENVFGSWCETEPIFIHAIIEDNIQDVVLTTIS